VVVGAENLSVGQHVVQFYGHDRELAERVSDYLRGALGDGGAAIVIATPEHRSQLEARLARAGADLAAARADGTYLTLDARETLREILGGATPDGAAPTGAALDRAAFDRVVGSVIRQAASSGRPVRAYGELVALLWDDGLVNAAAQLEALWDELGRAQPFSLFRGYQPERVPEALRTFAFSREAPATARHFAVATLREWGLADVADDAALVVTELAANAVVHAGSGFTVILSARGNVLRIAVRDGCPLPAEGQAALMPLPLHGLGAVDALAARWGVESLGKAGKTVWVDLRR
jgi:MEDS: MEthanogen/methylotroph, DcmR Sensory domain